MKARGNHIDITIKALTPDLIPNYFNLFDHRAFSDHADWSCCYCTSFHADNRQVEADVHSLGGGEKNLRYVLRGFLEKLIHEGTLQGYLAYIDNLPAGWCNAAAKASYHQFDCVERLFQRYTLYMLLNLSF